MAAMAVKDREEGALGPAVALLLRRLLHVQDDGYSILVVVADDALVGVCGVGLHNTILLHRILGRLKVGQLDM